MAPRPPLQINYARSFYLSMLVFGLVALVLVFVLVTDDVQPLLQAAPGQPKPDPTVLYLAGGVVLFCMGYYMWRALRRLRDPGPVIEVRPEGVMLRIGRQRRFAWDDISRVAMGRQRLRSRLEITVTPEQFAELRLPNLFVDDNFVGIRNKPFTIGITGQGFDRPVSDAFDEIRRYRPHLAAAQ